MGFFLKFSCFFNDFLYFFILFFNFTILYWFCHISIWICHRYTRVPHPEPSSLLPPRTIPLELSQCTSPKHQVSCIEPGLVTRFIYDIIPVSMPFSVCNLISGSSAFSKASLNIWKFTVHVLLKPGLENFDHYFARVWDECNCVIVWTFFGIVFLWDRNENWPFPALLSLLNLLTYWVQHFHSIIF